jgi:hypothetical protein
MNPDPQSGILVRLTHVGVAYVQVVISVGFMSCYFFVLIEVLHGKIKVPDNFKDIFNALLIFLTAQLGNIISFWFSRQRTSNDPKQNPSPGETLVKQVSTTQATVLPAATDLPPLEAVK